MINYKKLPTVNFEIAGKAVTRSSWHKINPSVTEEELDAMAEGIYEKIADFPCSTHKKMPQILCKGPSLDNIEFYVSGCCETYVDQIIEKIKGIKPTKKLAANKNT